MMRDREDTTARVARQLGGGQEDSYSPRNGACLGAAALALEAAAFLGVSDLAGMAMAGCE